MGKTERQKQRQANIEAAKKTRQRQREAGHSARGTIAADMHQPEDTGHGTSPGEMGRVKMESEEARHVTCIECGFGGGRHARMCSRGPGA